ncbi:MAG: type III polyketide synthase, partial [Cyclobacteriaceae bacterium]|nr:type III polyketide synthase [Cyclobacteriaceae bacterium]
MSFITSIGTATPPHQLRQSAIADFMIRSMQLGADDSRKLSVLFRASGIETRYSVIEDYGRTRDFHFFENAADLEPFPTTKRRIELYQRHALAISLDAAIKCLAAVPGIRKDTITHLI